MAVVLHLVVVLQSEVANRIEGHKLPVEPCPEEGVEADSGREVVAVQREAVVGTHKGEAIQRCGFT